MEKIVNYFSEAYEELVNKVTWPTWNELYESAIVVLVASLVIALIVVGMDIVSKAALQDGFYKYFIK
jgi:preprotein translocase subunit SecE